MIAWETRVIGWIPLPPIAAGAVVAGVLVVGAVLAFALTGGPILDPDAGLGIASRFRTAAVVSALVGYTMAAGRYLTLSISSDMVEVGRLRPEALAPENEGWLHGVPRSVMQRSRVAGCVGLVGAALMMQLAGDPLFDRHGLVLDGGEAWTVTFTLILFFLLARAAFMTAVGARERNDDGFRIPPGEIDLLDLRVHLVEGRVGLRLSLVWIVGSTLSSLLVFDPELTAPLVLLLGLGFGLALVALMLPTRRLHLRIRDAKRREIERVSAEVRAARDALQSGERDAPGRLADLLAYWDHLEGVREWPFDNRTLSRFVLYLLIPVGSWLGGALVERFVGRVLD